ncbi:hypothetical protein SDC9_115837 [bioreactor metagenome]|uniref:Uncharacterized protein n=1 Tax=bioreactor metagenome TaxID=1076179 RepID=A0A645BUG9_9ZZZZ
MAGNALHVHTDFHTASLTPVNSAVGGLGGDHEFGTNLVLVHNVLPAEAVTVLLLDGADHQHGIFIREQTELFHDFGAVNGGDDAAQLVGSASASDLGVGFKAFVRVELPVVPVADAHGVDMGVKADESLARTHIPQDVAHGIDDDFVKAHLLHLGFNTLHVSFFAGALTGDGNQVPEKPCHVRLKAFGCLFNSIKIHSINLRRNLGTDKLLPIFPLVRLLIQINTTALKSQKIF